MTACLGLVLSGALVFSGRVTAADDPSTDAAKHAQGFKLHPELRLQVWATDPQVQNGVAFSFDELGRCYVAETHRYKHSIFDITQRTNWLLNDMAFRSPADRQDFLVAQFEALQPELLTQHSEAVRVLEDRGGQGVANFSELFANGFNTPVDGTAAGVLARDGHVWFGNIPSLWQMSADPAAGPARSRTRIAHGFGVHIGVTGHDLHGLIRGPDGRIYLSFGDRGLDVSTETNLRGIPPHLAWTLRDTGGVLRCEPDGTGLELFCYGLRNPQELAFDDLGNLWTVDNDTAGADPCRVLHLVEGGDYGWRCSYQQMEGFGPWVQEELWKGRLDGILPSAGTVSQGPSGLAYYPGTGFGDRFAGRFLHCDFPGGIWAFSVKSAGASYVVDQKEKLLWNGWFTDVDFAPDGGLYVLDWVSGWQMPDKGRIYRITDPAHAQDRKIGEVRALLAAGMKARGEAELLGLLGHSDRRVRLEAHWELANRGPVMLAGLTGVALNTADRLPRLHALWAIGRIVRRSPTSVGVVELASLLKLFSDADPEIRGQAVLTVLGDGRLVPAERAAGPLLEDVSSRVRLLTLQAYNQRFRTPGYSGQTVRIPAQRNGGTGSVEGHFPSLEVARLLEAGPEDAFLIDAAAQFLTLAPASEFSRRFQSGTSVETRLAALLALRRQSRPGITAFLADASPRIVTEAGRAIHDVPIVGGFAQLAQLLTRVDCPAGLYSRALDAGSRLGSSRHATVIANFAARTDVPAAARALAIRTLGEWAAPSPLDRVNGLWRPMIGSQAPAAQETESPPAAFPNPALAAALQAAAPLGPVSRFDQPTLLPPDLGRSAAYPDGIHIARKEVGPRKALLTKAGDYVATGDPAIQLAVIAAAIRLHAREASSPLFDLFESPGTSTAVRSAIVPALVALKSALAGEVVRKALLSEVPTLRSSAVPHLDQLGGDDALTLLTNLVETAAAARDPLSAQAAYGALARMGSATADRALLTGLRSLRSGTLPTGLRLDVTEAAGVRAPQVPELADELQKLDRDQPVGDPLTRFADTLQGGSSERGRALFFDHPAAQCLRCHQVGAAGGTVGPKLDGIGKLRDRPYLLESIVQPNRHFAEGFEPTPGALSAMPEGMGDVLTRIQIRDLIEFLAGLK